MSGGFLRLNDGKNLTLCSLLKEENDRAALLSFAAYVAAIIAAGNCPARSPGGSKLPIPANFRVAAKTAYTVKLAWDPAPANWRLQLSPLGCLQRRSHRHLPKTAINYTLTLFIPGIPTPSASVLLRINRGNLD
jgi:hypothetical protein